LYGALSRLHWFLSLGATLRHIATAFLGTIGKDCQSKSLPCADVVCVAADEDDRKID